MAVILSDLSPTPRAREICYTSVQRAKLLEGLALGCRASPRPPESMFLLGLLSQLDALLGTRMQDILAGLSLDEELAGALRGESNRTRPWLDLVIRLETGAFEEARELMRSLGLDATLAAVRQAEAAAWAQQILSQAA